MTDKKKAKELASLLVGEDQNQEPLVEILIEMAQWKEQQMMKDALDAVINSKENDIILYQSFPAFIQKKCLHKGDKVKIIIIKEV